MRKLKGCIVSIDGPAGAGKSTVSRQLADTLGGNLLDTGSMYRAVAYFALKESAKTTKEFQLIAKRLNFEMDPKTSLILVDGKDMGARLRTPKVSDMASYISQFRGVRDSLTRRQRSLAKQWCKKRAIIVEGRDIGTVVFPDIRYKFFVTASADVRAKRRYYQLKKQGTKGVTLKSVLKQQKDRDDQDSNRKIAPLRCPEDAIIVDTSEMGISQVVHFLATHIRRSEGKLD